MAIDTGASVGSLPPTAARAESLTVRDDRTGETYVIPIDAGAIRATALNKIKTAADDPGLLTYDPGFITTAAVKSAVTYIDGPRDIRLCLSTSSRSSFQVN